MTKNVQMVLNWWSPTPSLSKRDPEGKVHRANIGPIWGRQDPSGPHAGPMNFCLGRPIFYVLALLHPTEYYVGHFV